MSPTTNPSNCSSSHQKKSSLLQGKLLFQNTLVLFNYYSATATASISTSAPLGIAATSKAARAGVMPVKNSA